MIFWGVKFHMFAANFYSVNEVQSYFATFNTLLQLSRELTETRQKFSYHIFVHGSKCQFIDGINLNLTHVCVCCEIIFVFTYIAFVVFVYKVKKKKKKKIYYQKCPKLEPRRVTRMASAPSTPLTHGVNRCNASVVLPSYSVLLMNIRERSRAHARGTKSS